VVDHDLVECDFGAWQGKTFVEVSRSGQVEMDAWLASPSRTPGGESFVAVAARVRRAVARLRETYLGQVVVVASHVAPIKILLRDARRR
jgi:probable phosphoglycerate mutase